MPTVDDGDGFRDGEPSVIPEDAYRCVHQLFETQAARAPQAVALTSATGSWTYAHLNSRANRLAHWLRHRGVLPGDLVGLRMQRSFDTVATMLAAMKAGAGYVPLEETLPVSRIRQMAAETALTLAVVAPPLTWPVQDVRAFSPADEAETISGFPQTSPEVPADPDAVLYVLYTSGSTGRPKGTLVQHRTVPGFFRGNEYADWSHPHVTSHHSALSWDAHLLDLYPSLVTGGSVFVQPAGLTDPVAVARNARDAGVDVIFLTTAGFHIVIDTEPSALAGIGTVLIGGEVTSPALLRKAIAELPASRFANCYGPSECTVFTTAHIVEPMDHERRSIPIGRPLGDRRVVIADADGRPVRAGEPGELCVGGPGVSYGYLDRPELTAQRFVPDPDAEIPGQRVYRTGDVVRALPDGALDFVGRVDRQVKVRGLRIELEEIEAALRELPGIRSAVVTVREDVDGLGGDRIVGYVVPAAPPGPTGQEILSEVAAILPAYMLPSTVVTLDAIPLTHTGKIDRRALPEPVADAGPEDCVSATERALSDLWCTVLGVERVGRTSDFLGLGGNSLTATRLVSRIRHALGVDVSPRDVFEHSVLADLAALIEAAERSPQSAALPPIVPRRAAR